MKIAFQIIPESEKALNSYQYVNCHIVFDIKMEDCIMTCLVVRGQMTHTLDVIIYSSVITRESVHIALTIALLHDQEVREVMAHIREKIRTVIGSEFGDDAGMFAIIVEVL